MKSAEKYRKPSRPTISNNVRSARGDSSDEKSTRNTYCRKSSSSSSSHSSVEDVERQPPFTSSNGCNSSSNNIGNGNTGGSNCANVTVVGVVRPHQRKPPSPQIFSHIRSRETTLQSLSPKSKNEDCFNYLQQRSLRLTAPDPQCDLVAYTDKDNVVGNISRNSISERFTRPHTTNTTNMSAINSADKTIVQSTKSTNKVGRKPKSPSLGSVGGSPMKKKRGRKRTLKIQDATDSDDEESKVSH